jgi:hypothetical protein
MYVICVLAREVRLVGRAGGTSVPRLQPTTHHRRAGGFGQPRPSAVVNPQPIDDIAERRRAILRQLVVRLRELRRRVAADEQRMRSAAIPGTSRRSPATGGPPQVPQPPADDVPQESPTIPARDAPLCYRPAELDDSSSDTVYEWMNATARPMERPDRLEFEFHPNVTDELFVNTTADEITVNTTEDVFENLFTNTDEWDQTETMGARLRRMERAFSE